MLNFLRPSGPRVAQISPTDAVEMVRQGKASLVDIRDAGELRMTGRAKGAVHIPLTRFRMEADPSSPEKNPALDPAKPVILYCATGARSGMAARMMLGMGYETVYNLGGLAHWQQGGGAVST